MAASKISLHGKNHRVSGLWLAPDQPSALLVLAHGAGAGMSHPFMEQVSDLLCRANVATLRFNFPYMEAGKKRPDPPATAKNVIHTAVLWAKSTHPRLKTFVGGKSFGGRMASLLLAEEDLPVQGMVYLGFPLHPPGKEGTERARHLGNLRVPQLFVQGTRDKLANLKLIRQTVKPINNATLKLIEGADHSFEVLKRSGRTHEEAMREVIGAMTEWFAKIP